jgi:hypothetical protein
VAIEWEQYPPSDIRSALEALWASLAYDPEQRALTIARLCLDHAPRLVEWAKRKIFNSMSDTLLKTLLFATPGPLQDGRLLALNALNDYQAGRVGDLHRRPQIEVSRPAKAPQRPKKQRSGQNTGVSTFEAIFGVPLQIIPTREEKPIRVDWEMGRLSIPLSLAPQYRFWVLGREITRTGDGSGVITRRALWQKIQAYRISYTKRHFNRLLAEGEGLFWHRSGKHIYLSGIQPVAREMTRMAQAKAIPTEYNAPGNREVLLDPSGSLEQWHGMLYAGWFTGRAAKGKWDVTISRAALSLLFGRDETTLRRWEENRLKNILTIRHNVAQWVEDESDLSPIPDHAQPYVARIKTTEGFSHEVRLMWQIPNTYHAALPMHSHTGQASKVRRAVNSIDDPADIQSGGQNRRYYPSPKNLHATHRSRKFRMGLLGDVNRRIYVYLGTQPRNKRGVFEYTAQAVPITHQAEREQPKKEAIFFATEGAAQRHFWKARREAFMA